MAKTTLTEVIAAITVQRGGTNYPPVEVNERLRKIIQTYIDMKLDAQTIITAITTVQKTWWQMIGSKLFKQGKK